MDRYQRVEKPRPETPVMENEIRITSEGKMRNSITYATKLLQNDKGPAEIIIKGVGRAINKAVTIAEIIKRRIAGLHQITSTGSIVITDSWEPLEEGLFPLETTRYVSIITVTLSTRELDTNSSGYQPPLRRDRVAALAEVDYDGGGAPNHLRGRGRGNFMTDGDFNGDGSYGHGGGRGRGRGQSRGRGRGRGRVRGRGRGYAVADANPDKGGPRGRGRGRLYRSDEPVQANDKGGDAQYNWEVTQEQYDKRGDAQYDWEVAQEKYQKWHPWGGNSKERHYYLQLSDVVGSEDNVIWWIDTIEDLMDATSYFKSGEVKVVGIDCEWQPNFVKGQIPNQISILQIATGEKVLIFDLIFLFESDPDALDTCLKAVFHSPNILKLGYDFHRDLEQLAESYGDLDCFHFCDGILDLQRVFGSAKGGLSGLTKTVLGSDLNKERRMSNWEQRPLTPSQLHYAALDAAVLIPIFNKLCFEPSSNGGEGIHHTSNWKSLITHYTTDERHKRNPEVRYVKSDLAGASMGGEFADNQISREKRNGVPLTDSESKSTGASGFNLRRV